MSAPALLHVHSQIAPGRPFCSLSASAKLVWSALASAHTFRGGCFPSQSYLAQATSLSRSTINRCLRLLVRLQCLERHRRVDPETGAQRSTLYDLRLAPCVIPKRHAAADARQADLFPAEPEELRLSGRDGKPALGGVFDFSWRHRRRRQAETAAVSHLPPPVSPGYAPPVSPCDSNLTNDSEHIPAAPAEAGAAGGACSGFGEFWDAYPLKRDRVRAEKVWRSVVGRGAHPDDLLRAVRDYARSGEVARGFPMKASNWLSRGSWRDFVEAGQRPGGAVSSLREVAEFWARSIREGRVVPSHLKSEIVDEMLEARLLSRRALVEVRLV